MENRLRPRVHLQCSVVLTNDRFVTEGTVLNLCVAGCAVSSKENLSRGEYVELDLHLPDQKQPLRVPVAKVRWSDKGRYGMEFLKFTWEHEDRLGHLVSTYEQASAKRQDAVENGVTSLESRWRNRIRPLVKFIRTRSRC